MKALKYTEMDVLDLLQEASVLEKYDPEKVLQRSCVLLPLDPAKLQIRCPAFLVMAKYCRAVPMFAEKLTRSPYLRLKPRAL